MARRDAVYSSAWIAAPREGLAKKSSSVSQVTKQLPTVARKSHALTRQASGVASEPRACAASPSAEGVAEGVGESVESGCELGIDDSHVGVQPQRTARQVFVDLDHHGLRVE